MTDITDISSTSFQRHDITPHTELRLRANYERARAALGYAPRRFSDINFPDMNLLSPDTTFIWRAETLKECVQMIVNDTYALRVKNPAISRANIVLHVASSVFGVAPIDMRGRMRCLVLSDIRVIAMVTAVWVGASRPHVQRAFERTHKTLIANLRHTERFMAGIVRPED